MQIEFTSHSVERSLERAGMTGVELNNYIRQQISKDQIKPEKLFKQGIHHYWLKGQGIRLTLNTNILITVWKKP